MSSEREHGEYDARLSNLETMMAEVRADVKSLLAFRAAWLAVTGFVSLVVSLIVAWIRGN